LEQSTSQALSSIETAPVHFHLASIFLAVLLSLTFWIGIGVGIPSNSNGHSAVEASKQGQAIFPICGKMPGVKAQLRASPLADPSPVGSSSVGKPDHIRLRIATYNVHRCQGLDGRILPGRVASVLGKLRLDVIALQEVLGDGPGGRGQEQELGEMLGMSSIMAPAAFCEAIITGTLCSAVSPSGITPSVT